MATSGANQPSNGANNVIDMTGDVPAMGATLWPDSDAIDKHSGFHGLNQRKPYTLPEKRAVLHSVASIPKEVLFVKELLDEDSLASKAIRTIKGSGPTEAARNRNWTQPFTAEQLIRLHLLLKENKALLAKRRSSGRNSQQAASIAALTNMVEKAATHFDAQATVAKRRQSRGTGGLISQKNNRVQDIVPFDERKQDPEPCPVCKHHVCMPVDSAEEVTTRNKEAVAQNRSVELQESNDKQTGKRKRDTGVSQRIACYCAKMSCLCRQDGSGCVVCVGLAASGILTKDSSGCKCFVCRCSCDVLFPREKRQTIALKQAEKEHGLAGKS